jgi:peptidoglycan DL-endopeptidase CwlO
VPFAMPRRPAGRLAVLAVIAVAATGATLVSIVPSSDAYAVNTKSSTVAAADQAQAKLDALNIEADKAVEAFNQAQAKLDAATAHALAQKAAVDKARAQVQKAKAGIQTLAASEYENGTASSAVTVMLSDDPGAMLQKADLLAQVNRAQTANLTKIINADRDLQSAQARADQSLAAQRVASAQLAARKAAVQKALNAQQALLNSLQAQIKQQQAAAAAAREAQLRQQAASRAQARTTLVPRSGGGFQAPAPVAIPPAAGNARAALAYAYAQLGKPYVWGGAGPNSFDCSGLTMRAWGAAGVSLSHSAAAQQHEGRPVPMSAIQPGDLIFWGNPAYHVGIYVGGGQILDAPHTGTVVKIQGIWGSPSGAVRP